jgi:hypothetical protein
MTLRLPRKHVRLFVLITSLLIAVPTFLPGARVRADVQDPFSAYSQDVLAQHPVAYYHLDESSGTVAYDSSGNGYDASYYFALLNEPGVFPSDASVGVQGDARYITTTDQPTPLAAMTGSSDRTVELWFKTSSTGNVNIFHAGGPYHTASFDIGLAGSGGPGGCGNPGTAGLYFHGWDDDLLFSDQVPGSGLWNLADDNWHYVAVTVSNSGAAVTVTIDGQQPAAWVWNGSCYTSTPQPQPITMPYPLDTQATPIGIGTDGWAAGMQGLVDEVAIYPTALPVSVLKLHANRMLADYYAQVASGQEATVFAPLTGGSINTYGDPCIDDGVLVATCTGMQGSDFPSFSPPPPFPDSISVNETSTYPLADGLCASAACTGLPSCCDRSAQFTPQVNTDINNDIAASGQYAWCLWLYPGAGQVGTGTDNSAGGEAILRIMNPKTGTTYAGSIQGNITEDAWYIQTDNSDTYQTIGGNGQLDSSPAGTNGAGNVPANWELVCETFLAGQLSTWVDGHQLATYSSPAPITSDEPTWTLGPNFDASWGEMIFTSGIADLSIPDLYNALPAAEAVPGAPQSVTVQPLNGAALVTWLSPTNTGSSPITKYTVTATPAGNDQVPNVNEIGVTENSYTSTLSWDQAAVCGTSVCTQLFVQHLLADCHQQYTFTVTATNSNGTSPRSAPTNPVKPSGFVSAYPASPPMILILLDGAPSALSGGSYFPQNLPSYCVEAEQTPPSPNPIFPADSPLPLVQELTKWDLDPEPPGNFNNSGVWTLNHHYLTDPFAAYGGLILPYSYEGVSLSLQQTGATQTDIVTVSRYTTTESASQSLTYDAQILNREIQSVRKIPALKNVPIVVIGHSLGGDVAYTWWQNFGLSNPLGVTNVFSLDSPINGIANAYLCLEAETSAVNCGILGVQYSDRVLASFVNAWDNLIADDTSSLGADTGANGTPFFHSVGTSGDPTFGFAEDGFTDGTVSQLLENGCFSLGVGAAIAYVGCSPAATDIVSPCPITGAEETANPSWQDGNFHAVVSRCPGVVDDVAKLVFGPRLG